MKGLLTSFLGIMAKKTREEIASLLYIVLFYLLFNSEQIPIWLGKACCSEMGSPLLFVFFTGEPEMHQTFVL